MHFLDLLEAALRAEGYECHWWQELLGVWWYNHFMVDLYVNTSNQLCLVRNGTMNMSYDIADPAFNPQDVIDLINSER